MAYDELDRIASVAFDYGSFARTTTNRYDANSDRLTMSDAESGHDVVRVRPGEPAGGGNGPRGRVYRFGYDPDSRWTFRKYPNEVNTTYDWDAAGRLTKALSRRSRGATIESFEYTYDKAGNRLSKKLADGSVTTYEYDRLHPPVRMTEPGPFVATYTYDADDRLTEIDYGPYIVFHGYDNNGNRIRA